MAREWGGGGGNRDKIILLAGIQLTSTRVNIPGIQILLDSSKHGALHPQKP